MTEKMVEFLEVSHTFVNPQMVVLDHLSLEVRKNEFVTLLGPSGCGKTTVLKLIAGLEKGYTGVIKVHGQPLGDNRSKVGYMQQRDALMPWRTIYDNIKLPLELRGESKSEIKKVLEKMIPVFGLNGFESLYPKHLSGGMRQRAAFLRTFLQDSELMLLDEPFGALDALTRVEIQDWLLKVWSLYKKTILFITHDIEEAVFLSDRIYVLSQRPARTLQCLTIHFPRPRTREVLLTQEFLEYKKILMTLLRH